MFHCEHSHGRLQLRDMERYKQNVPLCLAAREFYAAVKTKGKLETAYVKTQHRLSSRQTSVCSRAAKAPASEIHVRIREPLPLGTSSAIGTGDFVPVGF